MTREEEISEASKKFSEYEYNQTNFENGFINGAKWADEHPNLESLWHDASEEPLLEEMEIIFINERDFAHISKRKDGHFSYAYVYYSWEDYVNSLKIKKWAYVKDLFPKVGEK